METLLGVVDVLGLGPLIEWTHGASDVTVAVIDGPVWLGHPALSEARIVELPSATDPPALPVGPEYAHGTFVAGRLVASLDSEAPGLCPSCTLQVRTLRPEREDPSLPSPRHLAVAINECVDAGAAVINVSLALHNSSYNNEPELVASLGRAARSGTLVVAAAGNHGELGASVLTRHPWVIPVVALGRDGAPLRYSTLGSSIGKHGLSAPGADIRGLGVDGGTVMRSGTSAAAPLVTGVAALLCSLFPSLDRTVLRRALTQASRSRRSVTPALLDATEVQRSLNQ